MPPLTTRRRTMEVGLYENWLKINHHQSSPLHFFIMIRARITHTTIMGIAYLERISRIIVSISLCLYIFSGLYSAPAISYSPAKMFALKVRSGFPLFEVKQYCDINIANSHALQN